MSEKEGPHVLTSPDGIPWEHRIAELQTRVTQLQEDLDDAQAKCARFQALYESAPIPYQSLDAEGRFLEVNQAWLDVLGYDRSEVSGRWFGDFLVPEQVPLFRERFPLFKQRGHVRDVEFRMRRKDGAIVHVSFAGRIGYHPDGSFRQTHCVFVDITSRKQAEDALHNSEQRLRLALESGHMGLWEWHIPTNRATWNARMYELLGLPPGDSQVDPDLFFRHVHPVDLPQTRQGLTTFIQDGRDFEHECRILRKDGQVCWLVIRGQVYRDAVGRPDRVIGVCFDVTSRRRAEEQLRSSEQRFRQLFATMHDGFALHEILCDPQGRPRDYRFLEVNPAFERLTGLRAADLLGRTVLEVLPAIEPTWIERYGQVAVTGQPATFEDFSQDLGRWFQVSAYCPHPGQFATVFEDITARKQGEADRLEMERRLLHAQRLESLGVLAGGIAHDFNNLLTVILGQAAFALQRTPADQPAHASLEEAIQAARRAADLTRQMLAYSGKGHFVLQQVDLSALVRENASLFKAVIARTIAMDLCLAADLPPIEADPGQLQQVVMNLITNAAEAIGNGPGTITLTTGVAHQDQASLHGNRIANAPLPGRFVCLKVADTGCGMDETTRQHLFDPFFTTKFTGRGLGMPVVLGVVKGHNGAILLDSKPGRGTTIRVLFPVSKPAAGQIPAPVVSADASSATGEAQPLEGLVLVVDDEPPVRNLCRAMLESLGMNVLTAADGQEALTVFRKHADRILCVVLDLSMPNMGGRAALQELHRIQPDVKVLLSSGYAEPEDSDYPSGRGPAGFLHKPYSLDALEAALRKALAEVPGGL